MKTKAEFITESLLVKRLKRLPRDCHKGSNGTLNIIAGCERFRGAADLCVGGALRTGCGIVRLISEEKVVACVAARHPSCTFLAAEDAETVKRFVYGARDRSFLIGCGISQCEKSAISVSAVLAVASRAVLDADALNIISSNPQMRYLLKGHIITPHLGEFSRLTGLSIDSIKQSKESFASAFAREYGCVTVLKDSVTVIATPDGELYISDNASEGLSKGGSGDVLTGLIAGFFAQGYTPEDAAVIGVAVHALASVECASELGRRSMLPSELEHYAARLFSRLGY